MRNMGLLTKLEIPASTPQAESGAGEDQRKLLDQCRNCSLWKHATQAVPGEGPTSARMMLVGEQPGDQEDLAGRPFVGPAGQLLDRALAAAGIKRSEVYVTNAVKHFKYELRGKRRLHKPAELEIAAPCVVRKRSRNRAAGSDRRTGRNCGARGSRTRITDPCQSRNADRAAQRASAVNSRVGDRASVVSIARAARGARRRVRQVRRRPEDRSEISRGLR